MEMLPRVGEDWIWRGERLRVQSVRRVAHHDGSSSLEIRFVGATRVCRALEELSIGPVEPRNRQVWRKLLEEYSEAQLAQMGFKPPT